MNAEFHYQDEHLIAMLETGDEEAIVRNPHLVECKTCREGLAQYRSIVSVLGDEAAWDLRELKEDADPSTIALLRSFTADMQREDEDAETYVTELLSGARETWMPRLRAHPEWRTAGVVRKLAALSYPTLDKMPPDAVEITNLAVEIAEHIDPSVYPRDTGARLRGAAWREKAYALFYVGKFHESLTACDRADAAFAECVVDEYDRARVDVIRALSLRPLDDVGAAARFATDACATFERYADRERFVKASLATVHLDFKAQNFAHALPKLLELWTRYGDNLDEETQLTLSGNLAFCYKELGQLESAIDFYQITSAMLERRESVSEAARIRWNVASLLAKQSRVPEALAVLEKVRADFDHLEMCSESTLVGLDIAELLLVESRVAAAEALCRELCSRLDNAGLATTSRAMVAVAFLQEAVSARRATPKLARHVRAYVQRLPEEPNLLFAPLFL